MDTLDREFESALRQEIASWARPSRNMMIDPPGHGLPLAAWMDRCADSVAILTIGVHFLGGAHRRRQAPQSAHDAAVGANGDRASRGGLTAGPRTDCWQVVLDADGLQVCAPGVGPSGERCTRNGTSSRRQVSQWSRATITRSRRAGCARRARTGYASVSSASPTVSGRCRWSTEPRDGRCRASPAGSVGCEHHVDRRGKPSSWGQNLASRSFDSAVTHRAKMSASALTSIQDSRAFSAGRSSRPCCRSAPCAPFLRLPTALDSCSVHVGRSRPRLEPLRQVRP
jgi:hypothetical protein